MHMSSTQFSVATADTFIKDRLLHLNRGVIYYAVRKSIALKTGDGKVEKLRLSVLFIRYLLVFTRR